MKIRQLTENTKIRSEVHGAHHGQIDFTLYIEDDGEVVGKMDVVEFENTPSISMIEVFDKGKGYGKKLVQYLQSLYPDVEIEWGMTTEEGEKLRQSLDYSQIKSPYYDDIVEYERLNSQLHAIQAKVDAFYDIEHPTDEQKKDFFKMIEPMNDIHDRIAELEDITHGKKKLYNIVKF